ncbi:MAG: sigma-70 family RNA polymerase sigma factor [Planctomycetes bacterium]|nr:sigma-70 family RNA polymerase sigma factor [Planctomycetota bacterium]
MIDYEQPSLKYTPFQRAFMSDPEKYITRQTLLSRVKNKDDQDAWQEFSEIYKPFIRHILKEMNVKGADQEDLHQEVLLKLWNNMMRYEKTGSRFRAWLSVVIRNIVYNFTRSSKRYKAVSLADDEGRDVDYYDTLTTEPEVDAMIEREWKVYLTKIAFDKIQPLFSENAISVLKMSIEGKTQKEISMKLGIKESSVKALKSRVRGRFEGEIKSLIINFENINCP